MDKIKKHTHHVIENGQTLIEISLEHPSIPQADLTACFAHTVRTIAFQLRDEMIDEARFTARTMPSVLPFFIRAACNITCHTDHTFSSYTDVSQFAGGLHTITYRYATSWTLQPTPKPLFFHTLVPGGIDALLPHITQDSTQASKLRTHFSPENVYLTPDNLVIFYQPHTIAPPAGGIPTFSVPYHTAGFNLPGVPRKDVANE